LRIISGKAKGLILKSPKGFDTRPTSDRVKEAVFSMISPYLYDAKVLDLFSGTGNLSIESISRNASMAYLVEKNRNAINVIKENIARARFENKIQILSQDVFDSIKYLGLNNITFDIIFMDPPYLKGYIKPTLEAIILYNILEKNGIIVIEHDRRDTLDKNINSLIKFKEKKYGNTIISIYSKEDTNDNCSLSR